MKKAISNFSFPYFNVVLIFSTVMIFTPILYPLIMDVPESLDTNPEIFSTTLLITSLLAAIGFIYCILGFHFKITRGDELKYKIHLEALNVSFTSTLVLLFILIFIFVNFAPTMLNWIMLILGIEAIVVYLVSSEILKEKYQ
ncbi:MAG: hypothetical protein K9J16_14450 [Melioribacteraceae bacterium]|nr:hypothetical protein [Melioribacteraceae bacterium]MCF8354457.1 hypothetical protein [Melioribacteraceae bacterium]MCF8394067.1 hypothetical protein [Melioribacteraceae bacterium]MCF8419833.1 hypothetical protein [Melioribacteraceae bacterium]